MTQNTRLTAMALCLFAAMLSAFGGIAATAIGYVVVGFFVTLLVSLPAAIGVLILGVWR